MIAPSPRARLQNAAPDIAAGLAIVALVIAVIRNFWQTGVASNADMLIGVYRTFELDQALGAGVLFPRIMPGLNFGYGGPLFQFYPPLTAYLSLFFHWLGLPWIEANKAVFTAALLLGGLEPTATPAFCSASGRPRSWPAPDTSCRPISCSTFTSAVRWPNRSRSRCFLAWCGRPIHTRASRGAGLGWPLQG